jgi:hypothetical protein
MSEMDDRLKRFLAKPKTFKKDDWEITLSPLKGKHLDLMLQMTETPTAQDTQKLVHAALINSGYELSLSDVDDLGIDFIMWVFECLGEMNGTKPTK